MIRDTVVVDAVVHPYNLARDNQNPDAQEQLEAVYRAHVVATGPDHPDHLLQRDEFFSDFPFAAVALGVDGLKLYPAFFYDGRGKGWRLDGPDFAPPLLAGDPNLYATLESVFAQTVPPGGGRERHRLPARPRCVLRDRADGRGRRRPHHRRRQLIPAPSDLSVPPADS